MSFSELRPSSQYNPNVIDRSHASETESVAEYTYEHFAEELRHIVEDELSAKKRIDLEHISTQDSLELLTDLGYGERVCELMKGHTIDLTNSTIQIIVYRLIKYGYGARVCDMLKGQRIQIDSTNAYSILDELVEHGFQAQVTELTQHICEGIDAENIDITNDKTFVTLSRLIEFGHGVQVCNLLKSQTTSLDQIYYFSYRLLYKLIQCGYGRQVTELTRPVVDDFDPESIDEDHKLFQILRQLRTFGHGDKVDKITRDIVESISTENIELTNDNTYDKLDHLIEFGQGAGVCDLLAGRTLDLTAINTYNLLIVLIEYKQGERVCDLLKEQTINLYSIYTKNIFDALVNCGYSSAVTELTRPILGGFQSHGIDFSSLETYTILKLLIRYGHGDAVAELTRTYLENINSKDIDILDNEMYKLLSEFIEFGHGSQVAELTRPIVEDIDLEKLDFTDSETQIMLNRLIEFGHGSRVCDLFEALPLNVFQRTVQNILSQLIKHGYGSQVAEFTRPIVEEIESKHLDATDSSTLVMLHRLVEYGHGEQICNLLKGKIIDLANDEIYELMILLMKLGYGEQVCELLGDQKIDFLTQNTYPLLIELKKLGYEAQVKDLTRTLVQDIDVDGSIDASTRKIIKYLCKFGHGTDIICKLPSSSRIAAQMELEDEGVTNELRRFLKVKMSESLFQYRKTKKSEKLSRIMSRLDEIIDELGLVELSFLEKIAAKHGYTSRTYLVTVFHLAEGKPFVSEMFKTGSELHIYGAGKDAYVRGESGEKEAYRPIVFLHRIKTTSADVWQKIHDAGVPVAPIVSDTWVEGDTTVVPSRYCGLSLDMLKMISNNNFVLELMYVMFASEQDDILDQLSDVEGKRIDHGHGHTANATVEWIKKEYYDDQINNKHKNVNTIPFHPDAFKFDPSDFLEDPRAWVPVVRMIDWDQAIEL